jgi:ArsR family transcriptional regulator
MEGLAVVFKALSDESRLRIINLLFNSGGLCVCDIQRVMGATQTKVSRHLAYLRRVGLVDDRRQGLWMLYSIAKPKNEEHKKIVDFLGALLRSNEVAQKDARRLAGQIQKGCCSTYSIVMPSAVPAVLELNRN